MSEARRQSARLPRAASAVYERHLAASDHGPVAGVDEAGCGALAGPVVAAAVVLPAEVTIPHVTDSKLLRPTEREHIYREIIAEAACWSVFVCPHDAIDRLNIYQARLLAMRRAIEQLEPAPGYVLIDGHVAPELSVRCEALVGGDAKYRIIAAASIVAKVTRDQIMERLDPIYPGYGFARHKGYATAAHMRAIAELGPCAVHRRTFAPVADCIQQQLDYDSEQDTHNV